MLLNTTVLKDWEVNERMWMWPRLCDDDDDDDAAAAAVAWMLWFALAWVQWRMLLTEPFLTPPPHPQGWQPTLGEEKVPFIPSLSWLEPQSLRATLLFPPQEQSHVKARAWTNLLWSWTLTLPDARLRTPSGSSAQRGANDIMYKDQDLKSPEIKRTRSVLSVC